MAAMKKGPGTGKKGGATMKGPYKSGLSKAAEKGYPSAFSPIIGAGKAISKAPMRQQGPKESGFASAAKGAFSSIAAPLIKAGGMMKKKMQKPLPPSRSSMKRK